MHSPPKSTTKSLIANVLIPSAVGRSESLGAA